MSKPSTVFTDICGPNPSLPLLSLMPVWAGEEYEQSGRRRPDVSPVIHVSITSPFILPGAIACRSNDTHDAPPAPAWRPPPAAADAMPPPEPEEVKSGRMYKGWVFRVPRVDFALFSPSLASQTWIGRQKRRAGGPPRSPAPPYPSHVAKEFWDIKRSWIIFSRGRREGKERGMR